MNSASNLSERIKRVQSTLRRKQPLDQRITNVRKAISGSGQLGEPTPLDGQVEPDAEKALQIRINESA
ncbi:MAG: hypothetical protein HKN23_20840 [Verrucomicrobiales bacterium]|nr:hypothetical protein [Verrucomicrobiales bacterium]